MSLNDLGMYKLVPIFVLLAYTQTVLLELNMGWLPYVIVEVVRVASNKSPSHALFFAVITPQIIFTFGLRFFGCVSVGIRLSLLT